MKIILIKTPARTQPPQPPTLSEAGEPASASGHQTRRQLGDSRAVKTTPVNASLAPSEFVGCLIFYHLFRKGWPRRGVDTWRVVKSGRWQRQRSRPPLHTFCRVGHPFLKR